MGEGVLLQIRVEQDNPLATVQIGADCPHYDLPNGGGILEKDIQGGGAFDKDPGAVMIPDKRVKTAPSVGIQTEPVLRSRKPEVRDDKVAVQTLDKGNSEHTLK